MMGRRKAAVDKEALHRAVDGELSKGETRRLKAVLRGDPGTRAELESLKAVARSSRKAVQPVKPPADFKRKVLGKLKGNRPRD